MTTTKDPPPDPIADIVKDLNENFRLEMTDMWRHWFNTIKTTSQTNIADASVAHAVSDWATTNTALDALGTKINSILDILESIKAMEE